MISLVTGYEPLKTDRRVLGWGHFWINKAAHADLLMKETPRESETPKATAASCTSISQTIGTAQPRDFLAAACQQPEITVSKPARPLRPERGTAEPGAESLPPRSLRGGWEICARIPWCGHARAANERGSTCAALA